MPSLAKRMMTALAALAMVPLTSPAHAILSVPTGHYVVLFEWDRSTLTPEALGMLDFMIGTWGGQPQVCFNLAGHTDRSRSAAYNIALSRRMADTVAGYLRARGVAPSAVRITAFGETRTRVPTRDGVREPQNRRVEIMVGPC